MVTFVARRLLISIPVLVGVSIVTFLFAAIAPGDPVSSMLNPGTGIRPSDLEALRASLGLTAPIPVRYLAWLGQMLQGNFGVSFTTHIPVIETIAQRLPNTALLMLVSIVIGLVIGVSLGAIAALRHNSTFDHTMTFVVLGGISVPPFLTSLLLIYLFAAVIPILPTSGMQDPQTSDPPIVDLLRHLLLPALVLSIVGIATFLRYTRASVLDVMRQDFVVTAEAKGLSARVVRTRHILRNALVPIVTIVGLMLPSLVGGAVFVEVVFNWPGIGSLAVQAALSHDYPVIMAIAMFVAVAIVLSNLATDLAYAAVDPRIRLAR